ncbi:MAG: DUF481 domain-containing protein [Bacteroidota bacterium]
MADWELRIDLPMRYLILLMVLLAFNVRAVKAQLLNVESHRLQTDTTSTWDLRMKLGFDAIKQKNSVFRVAAGGQIGYQQSRWNMLLLNDFQFVRVEADNIISSGYAHLRFGYWWNARIAGETFHQLQYDAVRGLDQRWLTGGGLRIALLSDPKKNLYLGVGAMFESEYWTVQDEASQDITIKNRLLKSTNYLSGNLQVSEQVSVNVVTYYQARFKQFFSPRLIGDARLNVKLNETIHLAISWVSTYDYAPIRETESFVYSLSNLVSINL